MNKEELLKEFNEKVEQLRDEFIGKLEEVEKKPFEVEVPEDVDFHYYVGGLGEICLVGESLNYYEFEKAYQRGLALKTYEEAEQYLKERKLLFKLHQWAKEKNEGWEPDFELANNDKYYIFYDYRDCELEIGWCVVCDNFKKLPYFKTREIAQECIDLFGDEIKEVLVNDRN